MGLTGSFLMVLPLLTFGARTIYDDFFTDVRYMGTNEE